MLRFPFLFARGQCFELCYKLHFVAQNVAQSGNIENL